MINYLEQIMSIKPSTKSIAHSELESLRREIHLYKKKYQNEDKDIEVKSDDETEIDSYELERINAEITKKQKKKKNLRPSISSEVKPSDHGEPKNFEKTAEEATALRNKCKLHFLFKSLNESELDIIINAFEKARFKPGDIIFTQGKPGNVAYLVEEGELTCEKILRPGDPPTRLTTYKQNDFFGEIALLYTEPRQTTVKAKTNITLWMLDKESYDCVTCKANVEKRKKVIEVLKKVEFFKVLNDGELGRMCDAMKEECVSAGKRIVNQGEQNDVFYVVYEGRVVETGNKGGVFEKGMFFNEMAMLNNVSRDVIAETDCVLFWIDRKTFKRVMGPMEAYLQRNALMFRDYVKKVGNKQ